VLYRDALKALRNIGEEWVRNIRDDEAVHMASTGT
jgi:hypothetical protein